MSASRLLLYTLGSLFVIGGLIMLFFETGLSNWVPSGIALAGLIMIVGVAVMGMADKGTREVRVEEEHIERRHD